MIDILHTTYQGNRIVMIVVTLKDNRPKARRSIRAVVHMFGLLDNSYHAVYTVGNSLVGINTKAQIALTHVFSTKRTYCLTMRSERSYRSKFPHTSVSGPSASPCAHFRVIPKLLWGTANIGNYKSSRIPNAAAPFLPGLW